MSSEYPLKIEQVAEVYCQIIRQSQIWNSVRGLARILELPDLFSIPEEGPSEEHHVREAIRALGLQASQRLSSTDHSRLGTVIASEVRQMLEVIAEEQRQSDRAKLGQAVIPMVQLDEQVLSHLPLQARNDLRRFIKALDQEDIRTHFKCKMEVRLFGSMARGGADQASDVDLAVISDDFRGVPWRKRQDQVRNLISPRSLMIRAIGITFSEMTNEFPSVIVTVRHGQRVAWR
jgi:hypothetical protein